MKKEPLLSFIFPIAYIMSSGTKTSEIKNKRKILLLFFLFLFIFTGYSQKNEKIKVTTERNYTINGKSVTEKEVLEIPKSKLLKNEKGDTIKTYFVIYDFKKGEYLESLVRPRVDRPIVYKIININRLAFDVQVNSSDIIVAETDWITSSAELKKITELFNQSKDIPKVDLEKELQTSNIKEIEKNNDKTVQDDLIKIKEIDSLKLELDQKRLLLESLKKKQTLESSLLAGSKTDTSADSQVNNTSSNFNENEKSKIDTTQQDSTKIQQEIFTMQQAISKKEKDITTENLKKFNIAKDSFVKAFNDLVKSDDKINDIVKASNVVIPLSGYPFLNKNEYKEESQKRLGEISNNLKTINITSKILNDQYINLVVSYNKLVDLKGLDAYFDKESYDKFLIEVNLNYENAKQIKAKNDLIDFEKIAEQVIRIMNLLEKDETYEYVSSPIQPKNDIATFEIDIKAKNKFVEIDNSRKFTHSEFVKRGTRIDFSIGLAASYFSDTNVYEIYTIDGLNKIGLKSGDLAVPSLITMISMTNRGSKYVAVGGSAGLGIDINSGKIQLGNFFIGPTIVLGKFDRIMFTPGLALRNVGRLKSGYEVDKTIITQSNDINSVLSDYYKLGFFVSLTYNLTNNVRNKISNFN